MLSYVYHSGTKDFFCVLLDLVLSASQIEEFFHPAL